MIEFADLDALAGRAGHELGTSSWRLIDQPMVDAFARLAGDRLWIHCDVERARDELPGGQTIVHGFLLLSMITALAHDIWHVRTLSGGVLYGLGKVRFPRSLPTGSRIRLRLQLAQAERHPQGWRMTFNNIIEDDTSDRPVCVAESVSVLQEASRTAE